MVRELTLLVFCGVLGFTVSGVAGSLYQLVTSRPPAFALPSRSAIGAFAAFLMFAFTGPFIITLMAIRRDIAGNGSVAVAAGGLVVAWLWSVCSGVTLLSFAISAGKGLI